MLDPPAFTKSRETIQKAITGYKEINWWGMKLVKPEDFSLLLPVQTLYILIYFFR